MAGVTTPQGTVLKGRSFRKVEKHWGRSQDVGNSSGSSNVMIHTLMETVFLWNHLTVFRAEGTRLAKRLHDKHEDLSLILKMHIIKPGIWGRRDSSAAKSAGCSSEHTRRGLQPSRIPAPGIQCSFLASPRDQALTRYTHFHAEKKGDIYRKSKSNQNCKIQL